MTLRRRARSDTVCSVERLATVKLLLLLLYKRPVRMVVVGCGRAVVVHSSSTNKRPETTRDRFDDYNGICDVFDQRYSSIASVPMTPGSKVRPDGIYMAPLTTNSTRNTNIDVSIGFINLNQRFPNYESRLENGSRLCFWRVV